MGAEQFECRGVPLAQGLGAGDRVRQHAVSAGRVVAQAMQELDAGWMPPAREVAVRLEATCRVGQVLRVRPGHDVEMPAEMGLLDESHALGETGDGTLRVG